MTGSHQWISTRVKAWQKHRPVWYMLRKVCTVSFLLGGDAVSGNHLRGGGTSLRYLLMGWGHEITLHIASHSTILLTFSTIFPGEHNQTPLPVGKKCWIDIKIMSTVDINQPSTLGQKWKLLWCQLSTSNWCQLLASNWCGTLKSTILVFHPKFLFNICCGQWSFSRHIRDIILTSRVHVHMIFAIWHQQHIKIMFIDVVPWLWPNVDVNLMFGCWLGCYTNPTNPV